MQLQLPLELLDHILSFLRDDHLSLRCCAEVNQVLAEMVEGHLYHQITLANFVPGRDVDEWKTGKLAKLFEGTPRLRSHVRALRISIASSQGLKCLTKPLTKEERIGEILPMFSQITTIVLSGKISWNRLHKTFREAFARMLSQTVSLENISITGTEDFPLPLLNHCKSLKRLSLIEMGKPLLHITGLPTQSLPDNEQSQLLSLDIEDDIEEYYGALPTVLTWLFSPYSPRAQHLSSLHIDVPKREDIQRLQALLEDCSSLLKEVYLRANEVVQTSYNVNYEIIHPPESAAHQVLNFYGFRSLRSLSISGSIFIWARDTCVAGMGGQVLTRDALSTFTPWFVQLLQTFVAPNNLEYIVLKITFYIDTNHPSTKPDWRPLTTALTSGSFPSLRRVEIHVKNPHLTNLDFPSVMAMLHSDLYSLVESGLLSIIEQPDSWHQHHRPALRS